ncbi:MAG: hypothetical protein M1839_002184 [Geoglossum umbratile]|nr:MAG: hypothetical protein M1839_002184 [Geoglossum umbratile]
MLCNLCRSIDFRHSTLHKEARIGFVTWDTVGQEDAAYKSGEYYVYDHHPTIEALRVAASGGCHLCAQIRSELFHLRLHESDEEHHRGKVEIRYYRKTDDAKRILPPKEIVAVVRTPIRDVKIVFILMKFNPSLAALLREKASNVDPNSGCEENIKLAITWLNRCLTTHELCTLSTLPYPALPTRILDVEPPGRPDCVCLRSTEGCHGPYITLSHVWGLTPTTTTTLPTLGYRMAGVPVRSMPRTFQDAVRIAKEMSIRYLWIDSLCIIQDCLEDWAKESSKMGEYYKNSLFTIAAVSAPDGSGGCFGIRDPLALTPCPIDICFPGVMERHPSLFLRLDMNWDPVDQTSGFQRPPLWQRAWVVQERLLSTRILRFSDAQMSWKCCTEEASERAPEGILMLTSSTGGDKTLQQALLGLRKFTLADISDNKISSGVNSTSKADSELMELYNAWYDLVTLYGKCKLTNETDIFPAISGLATVIANATGDRYVAGLWQHDLHRGLLWTAPSSTNALPSLRNYRSPSWSWASLKGTCNFHVREVLQLGKVRTSLFAIDQAQSHALSEANPFGEVISGELRITGLLRRAHPKGIDSEKVFEEISKGEDRETLFDLEQRLPIGYYYPDNNDREYLTEIWCSPVMTEERIKHPWGVDSLDGGEQTARTVDAHCLALYPLSRTDSIYMRVGVVWVLDFGWFEGREASSFSII